GERPPVLFSEAHAMNDDVDQLCRTIKTLVAEGDKAKAEAEQFYIAARRVLACSSRGATTDAACDCGVDYVPAGASAGTASGDHPEKSDRALAAEAGVTDKPIRRA